MQVSNVYNFLVHPFEQPDQKSKLQSLTAIVALTILTKGAFLGFLGAAHLTEKGIKHIIQKLEDKDNTIGEILFFTGLCLVISLFAKEHKNLPKKG